jgi:REP element-mobilizing transposase RayT
MPRHLRVEFSGAICHVTIRGNARQRIFEDDRDYERFLARLAESVETYRIRLYLFCLLGNHAHLLLETPDTNLSRFMQSVETGYTVYYNLRHRRVGHLFQGRYGAKLVDGDDYLMKLSRYIHLNPVFTARMKAMPKEQRISCLRDYRWSSYRSYAGLAKELKFVTYGPVLAQMGGRKGQRKRLYREFVEGGIAGADEEFLEALKTSPHAIGGDDFLAWARDLYLQLAEKQETSEDTAFRQEARRLPSEAILDVVCRNLGITAVRLQERLRNSVARPVAAMMLSRYGGLTNRAIARMLRLKSAGSVTFQLRSASGITDRATKTTVAAIEAELGRRMSEAPDE